MNTSFVGEIMDRQTAIERLLEALALALDENGILSLQDFLAMAEIMRINAKLTEGENVGFCMGFVIDRLRAHAEARATGGQPRQTLLLEALLIAQASPEKRAALQSWLAIATTDEIADDIDQLIRQLGDKAS